MRWFFFAHFTLLTLSNYIGIVLIKLFNIKVENMRSQSLDQKTIEEIKNRLIKTYNPREIYLLEPHGKNNIDVDIMVIVDDAGLQQRYALMAEGHKALIGIKIPKNILVYTKEEFEDYSNDQATLSYSIKQYGKKLYFKKDSL
jgi:uncharacterized protein